MNKKLLFLALFGIASLLDAECGAQYTGKKTVDCAECCKAGRAVTKECCEQCNGCQMYSDNGKAECGDFPS